MSSSESSIVETPDGFGRGSSDFSALVQELLLVTLGDPSILKGCSRNDTRLC